MAATKSLKKYRAAIEEKFPQLKIKTLAYHAEGWDSVACRVNEKLLFRFPKRAEVEWHLLKEMRLLPELAPRLPLAIPRFDYMAQEAAKTFPFAFAGYEMIEGRQFEHCRYDVREAEWWRPDVGAFLAALHAFPVERARELGVRDYRITKMEGTPGGWRAMLEDFYNDVQKNVFPLLPEERREVVAEGFEDFLENERFFEFKPSLIHGDLSGEHVLLDLENQRVTGIIDFGDSGIGDPAFDVWDKVLPYYPGTVDNTWQQRREFYGRLGSLHSIVFGVEYNDTGLVHYGLHKIEDEWFGGRNTD